MDMRNHFVLNLIVRVPGPAGHVFPGPIIPDCSAYMDSLDFQGLVSMHSGGVLSLMVIFMGPT